MPKRTKAKAQADEVTYLYRIPAAVPDGLVVVHNTVRPVRPLGLNGFRAWLQEPSERLEVCPCGWAPKLPVHHRVAQGPKPA
jgi:hypothetical protein